MFFLPVHRAVCWASISCLEVLRIANRPNLGKKVRIRKKKNGICTSWGLALFCWSVIYLYIVYFFRSNVCMCDPSMVCLSMSFFLFLAFVAWFVSMGATYHPESSGGVWVAKDLPKKFKKVIKINEICIF